MSISSWSTYEAGKKGCSGEGKEVQGRQYLGLVECQSSCDETLNCNSFVWNSKLYLCYLKNKPDACDDEPCDWDREDALDSSWYWRTCGNYFRLYQTNRRQMGINDNQSLH